MTPTLSEHFRSCPARSGGACDCNLALRLECLERGHDWRPMTPDQAYPASSGRVCRHCDLADLGWLGGNVNWRRVDVNDEVDGCERDLAAERERAARLEAARDHRQKQVAEWCAAAFGTDHAASAQQRGVRMLEEAIELYQACGCDPAMAHKLIDFIFAKPVGHLSQELGSVGLCILALAEAVGLSADEEEKREIARVLAKPLSHHHARNEAKNAAGFDARAYPVEKTEDHG